MQITKPGRDGKTDLYAGFQKPPFGYGIVPFFWWVGDPLTKERLSWQLEKLRGHNLTGLQLNYAHSCQGGESYGLTYPSDPPLFSENWWELVGWFMEQCKKEQMTLSLSDYTLGTPGQGWYTDEILRDHPDMAGQRLAETSIPFKKGIPLEMDTPESFLNASAVFGPRYTPVIPKNQKLTYLPEEDGILSVISVETVPFSLNPMDPHAGDEVCRTFFGRFEERFPSECGNGLNFFFSDELNFNISGNLWCEDFQVEFQSRKGYDPLPHLSQIYHGTGDNPVKFRLDYYDVIVQLECERYFQVVYQWHEQRDMIYGCDHGGRGRDVTEFGDYMRTQKYNQGPGCDQPGLQSDIVKNKVASSIAHLYNRPRVWLEGFYGSGWGTSSAQLCDAVSRNYTMGHNLLSLHGLYYTTHGGWWEWAPPCNCFRMPYWEDMRYFTAAVERLSYLMSQGRHSCDAAVLYPAAAVEGGVDGDLAVRTAFACGEQLYSIGIDLDYMDYESLLRAQPVPGGFTVSGETYQVLIIPAMKTARFPMLEKAAELSAAGTSVIFIRCLPEHSDSPDPSAASEISRGILKTGGILAGTVEQAVKETERIAGRQVSASGYPLYVHHRIAGQKDIFMLHGRKPGERIVFQADGIPSLWDPFDGAAYSLKYEPDEKGTAVILPDSLSGFTVIVFDHTGWQPEKQALYFPAPWDGMEQIPLPKTWGFRLKPCLDNRFGDFSLPASRRIIGAQARYFACRGSGETYQASYGPYYIIHEISQEPGASEQELLDAALHGDFSQFKPYNCSMRYGTWMDHGKQGYHGLKERVSDDFLIIGKPKRDWILNDPDGYTGNGIIAAAWVYAQEPCEAYVLSGRKKPDSLYLNGNPCQADGKAPFAAGWNLVIAVYRTPGRTHLLFSHKPEQELTGQTVPLAMKWYQCEALLPMDAWGADCPPWQQYSFTAPPALKRMEWFSPARPDVWIGGVSAQITDLGDGLYEAKAAEVKRGRQQVDIRLPRVPGMPGGAAIPCPIDLTCGEGEMPLEDWSLTDGLRCYSGSAVYSCEIKLPALQGRRAFLRLEQVSATVTLEVNGRKAGTKVCPGWLFEVTEFLKEGANSFQLTVCNTLANHYDTIPTMYRGDLTSGLIGSAVLAFG